MKHSSSTIVTHRGIPYPTRRSSGAAGSAVAVWSMISIVVVGCTGERKISMNTKRRMATAATKLVFLMLMFMFMFMQMQTEVLQRMSRCCHCC